MKEQNKQNGQNQKEKNCGNKNCGNKDCQNKQEGGKHSYRHGGNND